MMKNMRARMAARRQAMQFERVLRSADRTLRAELIAIAQRDL